jgi:hypothetical protein
MATLDSFLSRLMPHVSGCSDPLARQSLVDTAIDFCDRTNIVRVRQDLSGLTANVREYDLDLPSGTQLARVLRVMVGETKASMVPIEFVESPYAYYDTVGTDTVERGTPRCAYLLSPTTIGLFPPPAESAPLSLMVEFSIKPLRTATTLPDELAADWLDAIVEGAKARLYALPKADFAMPTAIPMAMAAYANGVSRAQVESRLGRVRGSLSVRPRRFAI